MLACLVLTFLYTKSNKKNSINHFICPTPQGIHEAQKNIYAEEKQKVILKNTHIHTHGEKLRKIIFLTIDLIPFLTIHPYNLMCIKYANVTNVLFHFRTLINNLSLGGKGSLCENMKK